MIKRGCCLKAAAFFLDGKPEKPDEESFQITFGNLIPVKEEVIPEGANSNEMMEIFQTIYKLISLDEDIIFDVTHSFRSIPILIMLVL